MSKDKKNDLKQEDQKWKAETLRAQRKARLAEMKSRDGGKKPVQYQNRTARVIAIAVIIIALLITGSWVSVRTGLVHRTLSALSVDGVKVTPVEVSYYYRSLLNNFGIDPETAEGQSTLNAPSGMAEGQTVGDYVKEMALEQVQEVVILNRYAQENSLDLSDEEKDQIDTFLSQIQTTATQTGVSADQYLATIYGPGMNRSVFLDIVERSLLSDKAIKHKQDNLVFADSEIEEQYASDKDRYDVAAFRVFFMDVGLADTVSDEVKEEAMALIKSDADDFLGRIEDEESFIELSLEYAPGLERQLYEDESYTLIQNRKRTNTSPAALGAWIFDPERVQGDKTIIEDTSGYYIAYFMERGRPEYQNVTIRHILITAREDSASEEEIDEAEAKAKEILDTYQSGSADEEAFAELAREFSQDGNAQQGGIYENVSPGQMVPQFNDWIFDTQRQSGDTDIVQTQFGFHVMYFVDRAEAAWRSAAVDDLRNQAFTQYFADAKEAAPYEVHSLGMRFVS